MKVRPEQKVSRHREQAVTEKLTLCDDLQEPYRGGVTHFIDK